MLKYQLKFTLLSFELIVTSFNGDALFIGFILSRVCLILEFLSVILLQNAEFLMYQEQILNMMMTSVFPTLNMV